MFSNLLSLRPVPEAIPSVEETHFVAYNENISPVTVELP